MVGVPGDRLARCGAVRYNDLREETRPLRGGQEKKVILVLTSQAREESYDLVEAVSQAAPLLADEFAFQFKCHYHCRLEDRLQALFAPLGSRVTWKVLDAEGPLHDYLRAADGVLAGGTTAALEALAMGHHPVIYTPPSLLVLSPLVDFPGVAERASDPERLAEAIRRAVGKEPPARQDALEKLFYRLDGRADARVLEFLKAKGLL